MLGIGLQGYPGFVYMCYNGHVQVAKAAMENAKRRKDVVKAMSACTKDKEKMLVDDSKRTRAARTPSTTAATPSTKTPDPKALKVQNPTPQKLSFQSPLLAIYYIEYPNSTLPNYQKCIPRFGRRGCGSLQQCQLLRL